MTLRGIAPGGFTTGALVLTLVIAGGCSSNTKDGARTVKVADDTAPTGPVQLAAFETGVGGVAASAPDPLWMEPDAVASIDGTSVFVVRRDTPGGPDWLVRLDPETGKDMNSWTLPTSGLSVAAVAPKARWIALTDRKPGYGNQHRVSTKLVVFDTLAGTELHNLTLTGDVQPEAFSIDGTFVFALNYVGDHYRVQTIALQTGERDDTSDRDKLPPENMKGQAVHGVMSKDRTLLATLYRNPGDGAEPAFVHVLDLQHGWSYCADLPSPFGTGAPGTDIIELTRGDTVVVAATEARRIAEIDINEVHQPAVASGKGPVNVTFRDGSIPVPDEQFRSISGFEYVIAEITP
jgi:hypothetical protein